MPRNKSKRKFNIIDIVLIVVLVLVIAAVVGKVVTEYAALPQDKNIRYVLETDVMDSDFSGNLKSGDKIYTVDGETCLGEVVSVSPSAVYHTGEGKDGDSVLTEIEDQTTLYVTVDTATKLQNGSFFVGDVAVSVGDSFEIRSKNLHFTASCVSVKFLNAEQD